MQWTDKVVLITGGSSGIGKAAALRFGREGVKVAVFGQDENEVRRTVEQIERDGGTALPFIADISDPKELQPAIDEVGRAWGRIDVVFANAGINGVWASLEELTPEDWDKTLDINLKGTFLTVKYALPYMKERGGAVIVTSSVNGTRTFTNTGATAYSCSKAGQVAFTKMVAIELAQYRIRVNVICPGAIETKIEESTERKNLEEIQVPVEYPEGDIPLTEGQPGSSEQVAELVMFLASDAADHITGTEMWIDGGQSLLH